MVPPRVVIAHPTRQHSHQTAFGLQQGGMLHRYLTPIWYEPGRWPDPLLKLLPVSLRRRIVAQLGKRSFPALAWNLVETYPFWRALPLAARRLAARPPAAKQLYRADRSFDCWAAGRLQRLRFDVFVGYEMASLKCFEVCQALGATAVLDLAALHWRQQGRLLEADRSLGRWDQPSDAAFEREVVERKRRELGAADAILVPSSFARDALLAGGIEAHRIHEIPYGVDLSLFRAKAGYRREGTFVVLFVGAIAPHKGVHHLLEALAALPAAGAELILVGRIAGGGGLLEAYAGRFRLVPMVPPAALVDYYQQADVLVLPSLLDSFGLVALEAMACGTPVVVTDHTGVKDVVRDGVDGFVVPSGDPAALAERMRLLSGDRQRLEEMGRQARLRAEAYPWALYHNRLREAIGDAMVRRAAGGAERSA